MNHMFNFTEKCSLNIKWKKQITEHYVQFNNFFKNRMTQELYYEYQLLFVIGYHRGIPLRVCSDV